MLPSTSDEECDHWTQDLGLRSDRWQRRKQLRSDMGGPIQQSNGGTNEMCWHVRRATLLIARGGSEGRAIAFWSWG